MASPLGAQGPARQPWQVESPLVPVAGRVQRRIGVQHRRLPVDPSSLTPPCSTTYKRPGAFAGGQGLDIS